MKDINITSLIVCPSCKKMLSIVPPIICTKCEIEYPNDHNIPMLFLENNWKNNKLDVTTDVKRFYEKTPFPDYEDIESISSLVKKAERGIYAKFLNEQIPFNAKVLEIGCGTGQLTNYLSLASREVVGTDMCLNSLRLAENFRKINNLNNAFFFQMNLFKPIFLEKSFDLVICQGVLHHTSDPYGGFKSIQNLVRPGGFIIIGLYNWYGRLITDFRRYIFNLTNDKYKFLDPRIKNDDRNDKKRNSWFNDQYKHPHESKHTISEVLKWFDNNNFDFVNAIPKVKPFTPITINEKLFKKSSKGHFLHHLLSQIGNIKSGYNEGGLFLMIGKKNV